MVVLEKFVEDCKNGLYKVEYRPISSFTKVLRGSRLVKNQLSDDLKYPVYHGGLEPLGYYSESNRPKDTVMIINVGASAGTVGFCEEDFWSSDGCFCLENNDFFNSKYLYYVLLNNESIFKSKVRVAGIPTLDGKVIELLEVPILPVEIQNIIVDLLNILEIYSVHIKGILPKEIEKRKLQYEYYRNKLLSFKEKKL